MTVWSFAHSGFLPLLYHGGRPSKSIELQWKWVNKANQISTKPWSTGLSICLSSEPWQKWRKSLFNIIIAPRWKLSLFPAREIGRNICQPHLMKVIIPINYDMLDKVHSLTRGGSSWFCKEWVLFTSYCCERCSSSLRFPARNFFRNFWKFPNGFCWSMVDHLPDRFRAREYDIRDQHHRFTYKKFIINIWLKTCQNSTGIAPEKKNDEEGKVRVL